MANRDESSGVSRRAFLQTAGMVLGAAGLGAPVGAAGAASPPPPGPAAPETTASLASPAVPPASGVSSLAPWQPVSDRRIRIGIVGGRFGAQFFWHEHPNCVVEAVSDLRPDRRRHLQEVYHCPKAYPSLEELIKDPAVEAVGIFTGAPDHVRHAKACLAAGKHVLCAVPAGMSVEECEDLLEAVRRSGLTYMLAETVWYHQSVITARQWYREGKFGRIYYTEAEYLHPGFEEYFHEEDGTRNWRHGVPPMKYPTHCTAQLIAVTGERLTSVMCTGWGDDSPLIAGNVYNNPFWNETAFFTTDQGNTLRAAVWWKGPMAEVERAQWHGERTSFYNTTVNGHGPIVRRDPEEWKKLAGEGRKIKRFEKFDQPEHWRTAALPPSLRHPSAHDCSHPFITHEFIDTLLRGRRPEIDIYEALALTVPGLVAHESALQGGRQLKVPVYRRS